MTIFPGQACLSCCSAVPCVNRQCWTVNITS